MDCNYFNSDMKFSTYAAYDVTMKYKLGDKGTYFDSYMHDIEICQAFARRNREVMANEILSLS